MITSEGLFICDQCGGRRTDGGVSAVTKVNGSAKWLDCCHECKHDKTWSDIWIEWIGYTEPKT